MSEPIKPQPTLKDALALLEKYSDILEQKLPELRVTKLTHEQKLDLARSMVPQRPVRPMITPIIADDIRAAKAVVEAQQAKPITRVR